MDIVKIEAIVDLMRKKGTEEIRFDDLYIKLFPDYNQNDEMSEELKKAIEKINNANDEEIMLDPYAGLES